MRNISGCKGEPDTEIIDELTLFCRKNKIDSIVSIGGGSIIDTGKAVSALVNNETGVENYLEGIGTGKKIINDPLPFIADTDSCGFRRRSD